MLRVACEGMPPYLRYRLFAVVGLCVLIGSCSSASVSSTQISAGAHALCESAPAGFTDVPEAVPGQSERTRALLAETRQEWQDQLLVPLDETVATWGPLLVDAGVIGDSSEAWDYLWVYASLDSPMPLRILDEVVPLLPAEVSFSGYAELDDGYPVNLSGRNTEELSDRFDDALRTLTTTTVVAGQPESEAPPDHVELAGLAASERDLRLVVPVYAIPVSFLQGTGYEALPLRQIVSGVQIGTAGTLGGWAKPTEELFTTSAGWRFCLEVAAALDL